MQVHRSSISVALAVITLSTAPVFAQKFETFEQARAISAQSGRPILLEFYRDD